AEPAVPAARDPRQDGTAPGGAPAATPDGADPEGPRPVRADGTLTIRPERPVVPSAPSARSTPATSGRGTIQLRTAAQPPRTTAAAAPAPQVWPDARAREAGPAPLPAAPERQALPAPAPSSTDRPAADRSAPDRPASDRSAPDRAASDRQASDRQASDRQASDRSAAVSGGAAGGWAQQVQQLARQRPQGADAPAPWKPPKDDPFLRAAQEQGRPAGLGRRLAARLLDSAVLGAVVSAAAVPLWSKAAEHIDTKVEQAKQSGRTVTVWLLDGTTGTYLGIVLAVLLVAGVVLEALPTAKWGRTLGKKLCGVRVLDIESHDTPGFGAALRRWLVYGVLGILGAGVLGVLWCLFDRPWRQCWHDKAARTFVAAKSG
ncbi:RDD family protein, partial [Streptomyces albireticuli]